jgi:hypothetical protein
MDDVHFYQSAMELFEKQVPGENQLSWEDVVKILKDARNNR